MLQLLVFVKEKGGWSNVTKVKDLDMDEKLQQCLAWATGMFLEFLYLNNIF